MASATSSRRSQPIPWLGRLLSRLLPSVLLLLIGPNKVDAAGGELATLSVPQMTPNTTYRQNVCDRYDQYTNDPSVELKDALQGLSLNVLVGAYSGAYFHYSAVATPTAPAGIDPDHPGLTAVLLDELARRAGFTWRQSFGIFVDPGQPPYHESWTDVLVWGTESFDLNVDWWAQNMERMNLGVAFLRPWYDSSIILIKKQVPLEISNEVNMWNWLRPYELEVWLLILGTIATSGLVFQWLEWLANERQNRTWWEWWLENCYLSAINFSQVYEYKPTSLPGRLFGVSMSIWALVMTATYTANLASLLVDRQSPPPDILTVAEAAVFGHPICTIDGHNSDRHIATNFPSALRRPQASLDDMYAALHRGDCVFAAETVASWQSLKGIRKYNPYCDLEWVGDDRKVKDYAAGFATKADSGQLCTGLIRDVLNLHLEDMIQDGFLEDAWDREYRRDVTIDCDIYRPELELLAEETNRTAQLVEAMYDPTNAQFVPADESPESDTPLTRNRQLVRSREVPEESSETPPEERQPQYPHQHHLYQHHSHMEHHRRQLKATKAAAGGAVAAFGDDTSSQQLTVEQMIGTFAFHWIMCAVAIAIGYVNLFHDKYLKKHTVRALTKMGDSIKIGSKRTSTANPAHGHERESKDIYESDSSTDDLKVPNAGFGRQTTVETNRLSDSEGPAELTGNNMKDMQEEIIALRKSQRQMESFQQQVLQEQRKIQEQLSILVQGYASSDTSGIIRAKSIMVSDPLND